MVDGSIYLPEIDLWCDAHHPVNRSFISHAHFDHLARHEQIITTESTRRLMASRMPGQRKEIVLPYASDYPLSPETTLRLYPAGHVMGSAMLYLDRGGETLLYTGDFKLRPGLSAEPCQPVPAEVLVMETTFGDPRFVFPPTEEVLREILLFCQSAIEDGEVPVLFGYSLGKSQEVLSALQRANIPVMLHPQAAKITGIYEELGQVFPNYKMFSLSGVAGHVVICPPQTQQSTWLQKIKHRRTAVLTGWALNSSAVYQYQCDAAFPLSDHAGYDDLLTFVEKVQPKKVFTVHGFVREFAGTLRELGIEAWALGLENQMEMVLESRNGVSAFLNKRSTERSTLRPLEGAGQDLAAFSVVGEKIREAASKLGKISLVQQYFASRLPEELGPSAVFFTGRPFSSVENRPLNCGWATIKAALLRVSGVGPGEFQAIYQKYRDGAETAQDILRGLTRPCPLSLAGLRTHLQQLAETQGPMKKQQLLEALMHRLDPLSVKYLIKILTGDLRIGLKDGLVEEALAAAFQRPLDEIREANMLSGDMGATALAAREGTLRKIELQTFHPIHFMLASPEPTAEAIIARLGENVWLEDKYDGIRCQVHKAGSRVELYSRELKCLTQQFPDLVKQIQDLPTDFVGDGELLAWKEGRALPFAELQKRLGRKGDDFFLGAEIPLSLWLYDLLSVGGKSLLREPLVDRRARLDALPFFGQIAVAPRQLVVGAKAIDVAFLRAREKGNEGLMVKDPQSHYLPGRRGLAWIKLKKAFATLDVVVVGVEWGHGKRRHVLSDYTFAVRDEATEQLLTVGKAYSGLTDAEIAHYTDYFLQNTLEERGRYRLVAPTVILEVAFDSIQASLRHSSGFALRFPRIVRIRPDKTLAQIDTLHHCRALVSQPS